MKINGTDIVVDFVQPRITSDGVKFVNLVGYTADDKRVKVALLEEDLQAIANKLHDLLPIGGKY